MTMFLPDVFAKDYRGRSKEVSTKYRLTMAHSTLKQGKLVRKRFKIDIFTFEDNLLFSCGKILLYYDYMIVFHSSLYNKICSVPVTTMSHGFTSRKLGNSWQLKNKDKAIIRSILSSLRLGSLLKSHNWQRNQL